MIEDTAQYFEYDPYNFSQVMREIFFYWFNLEPESKKNPPPKFAETYHAVSKRVNRLRSRIEHLYRRQKFTTKEDTLELSEMAMAFHVWIVDKGMTESKARGKTFKQVCRAARTWRNANELAIEQSIIDMANDAMHKVNAIRNPPDKEQPPL